MADLVRRSLCILLAHILSLRNCFNAKPPTTYPSISITHRKTKNGTELYCWLNGHNTKKGNVTWSKFPGPSTSIFENLSTGKKQFAALSQISIDAQQLTEDTVFTCKGKHENNNYSETWSKCKDDPPCKPPIALRKPDAKSVFTGSEVTVSCVVETTMKSNVSWLVNDKVIEINPMEGEVVRNLTLPKAKWIKAKTIKCLAELPCSIKVEAVIDIRESSTKTPTVEIRRNLADIKGINTVLECAARDLPFGELHVVLKANDFILYEEYVDLPKSLNNLTRRYTIPSDKRSINTRFTCVIESLSNTWTSESTGNLFDEPSVELSAVSKQNSDSTKQTLRCSATGFNPTIQWLTGTQTGTSRTMQADGRVTVISEISVPQEQWKQAVKFKCEVLDNSITTAKNISVCEVYSNSKPEIQLDKPSLNSAIEYSVLTSTCRVATKLNTKVSWFVDGQKTSENSKTIDGHTTVSKLHFKLPNAEAWKNIQTIKCMAELPCSIKTEKIFSIGGSSAPGQRTPTVEIRRNPADINNEDSTVLECVGRDLPSGELRVACNANGVPVCKEYVDLPEGLGTLTTRCVIPTNKQTTIFQFTCEIQSFSSIWTSTPAQNLFSEPLVELSASSTENPQSTTLLCFGTGFNPKIEWTPQTVTNMGLQKTMQADGRIKLASKVSVPQRDWNNRAKFTCKVSSKDQPTSQVQKSISVCAVTPDSDTIAVYLLPPSVTDLKMTEFSVTCLVVGRRLSDFSITWKVGQDSQSPSVTTTPVDHRNGTESTQSVLKVQAAKWNAYKIVSCEVKSLCSNTTHTGTISKTKASDLKTPTIRIILPSDADLSAQQYTSLICFIDAFRPAAISVYWELNGLKVDGSHFTNSPVANSSEGTYSMYSTLKIETSRRENGTFSCVVLHESSDKQIVEKIDNIYGSVNAHPPTVKLLQRGSELVCLVYGYSPSTINISWLLNNKTRQPADETSSSSKGPDGKFSIKSHLYLQASKWAPGATYTCLAQHVTGTFDGIISKTEFIEKAIYFDDNKSENNMLDQAEETWNMACAFIILFVISLVYGCSVTLIKVKTT